MQLLWAELVYPLRQKLCFIHLYSPQRLSQYFWITEVIPLHETSGVVEDKKLRRNLFLRLSTPPLTEKNRLQCREVPRWSAAPRPLIPLCHRTAIPSSGTALPLLSYFCLEPPFYTFSVRSSWSSPLRVFVIQHWSFS